MEKDGEIILVRVAKQTALYVLVALLGIIVEFLQLPPRVVVILDVVLKVLVVLRQHAAYAHRQRQTDVAVYLLPFRHSLRVHRAQRVDERVVAGNVLLASLHEDAERARLGLKLVVERGSLVAGVGDIEDILGVLGIEHQRHLRGALCDIFQLRCDAAIQLFGTCGLLVELVVARDQLVAQNSE